MIAAREGHLSVVELLIAAKASVQHKNKVSLSKILIDDIVINHKHIIIYSMELLLSMWQVVKYISGQYSYSLTVEQLLTHKAKLVVIMGCIIGRYACWL